MQLVLISRLNYHLHLLFLIDKEITPASPFTYSTPVDPISAPSKIHPKPGLRFKRSSLVVAYLNLLFAINKSKPSVFLVEPSGSAPESCISFSLFHQGNMSEYVRGIEPLIAAHPLLAPSDRDQR